MKEEMNAGESKGKNEGLNEGVNEDSTENSAPADRAVADQDATDQTAANTTTRARASRIARWFWPPLMAWQFAWFALLPAPMGKESLLLATILTAPLLLPLAGILRGQERALIWGGYLAMFCGVIGMVEFWSAPPERLAAGLQLALSAGYLLFLAQATRRRRRR